MRLLGLTSRSSWALASFVCAVGAAGLLGFNGKLHGELVGLVARQQPYDAQLALFGQLQVAAFALGLVAISLAVAAYQRQETQPARQLRLLGFVGGIVVVVLSLVFPM